MHCIWGKISVRVFRAVYIREVAHYLLEVHCLMTMYVYVCLCVFCIYAAEVVSLFHFLRALFLHHVFCRTSLSIKLRKDKAWMSADKLAWLEGHLINFDKFQCQNLLATAHWVDLWFPNEPASWQAHKVKLISLHKQNLSWRSCFHEHAWRAGGADWNWLSPPVISYVWSSVCNSTLISWVIGSHIDWITYAVVMFV